MIPESRQWVVQAQVVIKTGKWRKTVPLPTFLLHADIQGITSDENAEKIAKKMLASIAPKGSEIHVGVAPWEPL